MDVQKTGQLIARTRKEQGLTQRELAERLHVSDRAVSKWERGLNLPEAALFEPLCQALHITVAELLHGERAEVTVPALEQAVGEAVALAGEQERGKKRYWRVILVLLALLAAAGVLIGRPMWEDYQRQKYYDQDGQKPVVVFRQRRYPPMSIEMDAYAVGFYGPFEEDGSIVQAELAIYRPVNKPTFLHKVELNADGSGNRIKFSFTFEKSEMRIEVLRWPYAWKGTDVGLEDGEEVPFAYLGEEDQRPVYGIENLEPDYLYSVVIFWGDGYYAEYPFYTVETGG